MLMKKSQQNKLEEKVAIEQLFPVYQPRCFWLLETRRQGDAGKGLSILFTLAWHCQNWRPCTPAKIRPLKLVCKEINERFEKSRVA